MTIDLKGVVCTANKLVVISQDLPSNPEQHRAGGYLALGLDNLSETHVLEVGTYPPGKGNRYNRFCQEKMYRLYSDWLRNTEQTVSSWQTREPRLDRWGGAVLFERAGACNIVSFSGLNEECDEALSLLIGYHLGFPERLGWSKKIIEISKNPVFDEMWKEFNRINLSRK